MQTPNKHQQRTEHTRRKLLDAGLRVFVRDGFEAARIEDIAAAAGHTRGAFYANFETKEDLFLVLLEQQADRRLTELRDALKNCKDQEHALHLLRAFYVKRANNPEWAMLMLEFKLFAMRHSKLRAKLAAAHRRIHASMKFEALSELLPPHLCEINTRKVAKVMLEVALTGLTLENAYDPKRISRSEVKVLLGRIFDLVMNET